MWSPSTSAAEYAPHRVAHCHGLPVGFHGSPQPLFLTLTPSSGFAPFPEFWRELEEVITSSHNGLHTHSQYIAAPAACRSLGAASSWPPCWVWHLGHGACPCR